MLPLLAAALLAQAHVHESDAGAASGKDASVPMSQLPHPLDPDAPKPEGTVTKLQAGGQPSEAYVARPQGRPRGALLVLHEWWGLNDWVKHQADQLAKEGYLALAVEHWRQAYGRHVGTWTATLAEFEATTEQAAEVGIVFIGRIATRLWNLDTCRGETETALS